MKQGHAYLQVWNVITDLVSFVEKMINLFKIKGQKKDDAATANGKPAARKQSPGELRLHKGWSSWKQSCSAVRFVSDLFLHTQRHDGDVVLHNLSIYSSQLACIYHVIHTRCAVHCCTMLLTTVILHCFCQILPNSTFPRPPRSLFRMARMI